MPHDRVGHECRFLRRYIDVGVLTHLRPSGRRFNSGSTNGPTQMQKICFSVCRKACPALSRLGNCELSNEESNSGAVKSHAS